MFFAPETIALTYPSLNFDFSSSVSSLWLAVAALLPFLAMSFMGKGHDESCSCGHCDEIDMDALKKRVEELEKVADKSVEQIEELAELYVVQACCEAEDAEDVDEATPLFEKAENLLKAALAKNEDMELRRKLGNVYLHRAVVYNDFDDADSALEYYGKAIEEFTPLDEAGDGEAKFDIAGIRLNRGTIYYEMRDYEKAGQDFDDSFMAFRAVEKIGNNIDTRYYMAKVSVAQGSLFRDMGEPLEKIVDAYNRAMRLFVELIDAGQVEYERDLSNVLIDRCTATYEDCVSREFESETERTNKIGDVLIDVDRGIEILERLAKDDDGGDDECRLDLFHALATKGVMLSDLERYEESCKVFDRMIKEFADFDTEMDPVLLDQLAGAYDNRGNCLLNLDRTDEALADFDEAIRIRERMISEEVGLDEDEITLFVPSIAATYANRAGVHFVRNDKEKAAADATKGLELVRSLGDDDVFVEIGQNLEQFLERCK